jgi:AraC-like DNA-binding protein
VQPPRHCGTVDWSSAEEILVSEARDDELVAAADRFFQSRIPEADAKAGCAKELVREVLQQRDLLTVDDLARRSGLGKRTLQRLFSEYVGVSPKWIIRRYRLHEAIERFRSGEQFNCAQLAVELGYTPTDFQRMR